MRGNCFGLAELEKELLFEKRTKRKLKPTNTNNKEIANSDCIKKQSLIDRIEISHSFL